MRLDGEPMGMRDRVSGHHPLPVRAPAILLGHQLRRAGTGPFVDAQLLGVAHAGVCLMQAQAQLVILTRPCERLVESAYGGEGLRPGVEAAPHRHGQACEAQGDPGRLGALHITQHRRRRADPLHFVEGP